MPAASKRIGDVARRYQKYFLAQPRDYRRRRQSTPYQCPLSCSRLAFKGVWVGQHPQELLGPQHALRAFTSSAETPRLGCYSYKEALSFHVSFSNRSS